MKKLLIACFLLACTVSLIAAVRSSGGLRELSGWTDAKNEVARLEAMISAAKDAGLPPDPAWTARIRELLPQVKGHPGRTSYLLPEDPPTTEFPPGAVILSEPLTPLETEIRQLEFELRGGLGAQAPDPLVFADLKEQLNELYEQREVNRTRNPLDQGNDACPATIAWGFSYVDSGTTVGKVNNYNSLSPCNSSNAPDVIYEFTPQYTSTYDISLQGSLYDTYLYVNTTGDCPGETQIACNDDYGNLQSFLSLPLNAGQTYYVVVDGYSTHSGSYLLSITDLCEVECGGADIIECPEVRDSTHAYTDCNGACNNVTYGGTATWQEILPYQTVCGRTFTYIGPSGGSYRDTDAYRFTLTEACSLLLSVRAEFASEMYILTSGCPWSLVSGLFFFAFECSTATFYTGCLQPGEYVLWVGPQVYAGINNFREYRVTMELIPCNGCVIDLGIQAPASVTGSTCGYLDNCALLPSQDVTIAVVIPWANDWTFSLCGGPDEWDSYMYLTSSCCAGTITENDDGCGGVGFSTISCLPLNRGLYYLTIEGFSSTYCGPYTLLINTCYGSCCYGDPGEPTCIYTTLSDCQDYGGVFTFQEPCSTAACFTRPTCGYQDNFGQVPFLPGEAGDGYLSHLDFSSSISDNYVTDYTIASVRFWGFPAFCNGYAESFQIQFSDCTSTQTYNVSAIGTQLPPIYFDEFNLSQYDIQLDPPCTLTSGYVSIAKSGDPDCRWYWCTSPFGDGVWPSGHADLAFCLGAPCPPPDSVTIKWESPNNYMMNWWMPRESFVTVFSTTDLNSVFPAGYTAFATGTLPVGHFTWGPLFIPEEVRGFVLVNYCSQAVVGAPTGLTLVKPDN